MKSLRIFFIVFGITSSRNIRLWKINSIAKDILEKYKDYKGTSLFPFGFQQDYNEDLKVIFKRAGVDRMVTILNPTTRKQEHLPIYEVAASHMARRTFIGNIYNKV